MPVIIWASTCSPSVAAGCDSPLRCRVTALDLVFPHKAFPGLDESSLGQTVAGSLGVAATGVTVRVALRIYYKGLWCLMLRVDRFSAQESNSDSISLKTPFTHLPQIMNPEPQPLKCIEHKSLDAYLKDKRCLQRTQVKSCRVWFILLVSP